MRKKTNRHANLGLRLPYMDFLRTTEERYFFTTKITFVQKCICLKSFCLLFDVAMIAFCFYLFKFSAFVSVYVCIFQAFISLATLYDKTSCLCSKLLAVLGRPRFPFLHASSIYTILGTCWKKNWRSTFNARLVSLSHAPKNGQMRSIINPMWIFIYKGNRWYVWTFISIYLIVVVVLIY